MTRFWPLVCAGFLACPAMAQDHSGHHADHAGHSQQAEHAEPAEPEVDHSAMDHSQHGSAGHESPAQVHSVQAQSAQAQPENAIPPRALEGPAHAADAIWGAEAMASARRANHAMHGDISTGVLLIERFEARLGENADGYLWEGEGWYGGDINKLWFKSEGEGEFSGPLEQAEFQALYSRAITPFFDLQAGVRLDFEPDTRSHLALGVEGLTPYMWHVDAALFLSDRGDLTARIEGEYDQRLTQRLILQPRLEIELAAQDAPEIGIGSGFTNIEPGLRLRYEFSPEFGPYIGAEYEALLGDTADLARAEGEDPNGFKFLIGIRAWF